MVISTAFGCSVTHLLLDFGRRKQKHDTKRLSLKRIRVLFPKVETSKNAQTYLAEKVTKI